MQFFSPELARRLSAADPQEADDAAAEWERAADAYLEHLESAGARLPQALRDLALHDAAVEQVVLLPGGRGSAPTLEVAVRPAGRRLVLRYRGVRRASLDYDQSRSLFPARRPEGLGDWLADEVSPLAEGLVRHEILFESGATLLCEFTAVDLEETEPTS